VYVAAAPDLWYLKDTDGDRRADHKRKVFTGFGDRNQQGGANNLAWHVDHTIYGSGSTNGGAILPAGKQDEPPILLSGRDFRFDPRTARLETVTGSRQFGNAFDDWFERFICSESKPSYHVVLPQHYLPRNPHLAVSTAIQDLAPGVTPIFRTSPIEKWREIRSSRRLAAGERAATSAGLSHHVLDAAAGPAVYRGHAYPAAYLGQYFIGCSQNNLIHRRALKPQGATFDSARIDGATEFVRTTDTWFRPVNCVNAPDGTLYVLDMAREVIESIHIADDVVAHLDLTSGRDKGRIYRLTPPGFRPPPQPRLRQATTPQLVATLQHPGGWWRDTASRLLFERQDREAIEPLRAQLRTSNSDVGRMHTLWALEGLNALADDDLARGLADSSPGVRQHALRLAERRLRSAPPLLDAALDLSNDPDAKVRFQAALSLGESDDPRVVKALAAIVVRDLDDPWIRPAVLSSCAHRSDLLLVALTQRADFLSKAPAAAWLEELATVVGARNGSAEVDRTCQAITAGPLTTGHRTAVLLGLGAGLQRSQRTLDALATHDRLELAALLQQALDTASATAVDTQAALGDRQRSVRLLGYAPLARARGPLISLLTPRHPEALQLSAVRTLARHANTELAAPLVAAWLGATPKVQEEIIAALASRENWIGPLLDACTTGEIQPAQVPRTSRASLLAHGDPRLRERAEQLFAASSSPRADIVARYRSALSLAGDAARGDQVYQRECMACHRLGERGFQVGPNLALIRNRTPEALLEAIMDPNREVQPNYVNYLLVDDSGRTLSGLLQAETAASVTLARDKGVTETIQKQNIDELKSSGLSLMPEGLEKTIDPQGLADLLAFLRQVQYDIGTLPDFAAPKP
jgi:putative membrane-bound dehydrogenase-like protein